MRRRKPSHLSLSIAYSNRTRLSEIDNKQMKGKYKINAKTNKMHTDIIFFSVELLTTNGLMGNKNNIDVYLSMNTAQSNRPKLSKIDYSDIQKQL
jgi:hypothetical protein